MDNKKQEVIAKGKVRKKKKGYFQSFLELFLPEDANDMKDYMIRDVIIPHGKKLLSDIVETFLYGETRAYNNRTRSNPERYSYIYSSSSSRNNSSVNNNRNYSQKQADFSYDEISFENRGAAEAILSGMQEIIDQYEVVTIANFYDMAGITTNNFQYTKWGWTNLRRARVIRMGEGDYIIDLPKPMPLD